LWDIRGQTDVSPIWSCNERRVAARPTACGYALSELGSVPFVAEFVHRICLRRMSSSPFLISPNQSLPLTSILILNMQFEDDVALKRDDPDNAAHENSA
jgi:hypothetical protein